MLGGSLACDEAGFTNSKVIGGWDTGEKDALPWDSASQGTSVAGIAAGLASAGATSAAGDYGGGVAPGAKLNALKITKANGRPGPNACLAALRWIAKHWNDDPDNRFSSSATAIPGMILPTSPAISPRTVMKSV